MDYAIEQLQKKMHDTGIRLATAEIDMTSFLLARCARSTDTREKTQCLREARATLELASRLAGAVPLEDPHRDPLLSHVVELRARLEQYTSMLPGTAARRARLRRPRSVTPDPGQYPLSHHP